MRSKGYSINSLSDAIPARIARTVDFDYKKYLLKVTENGLQLRLVPSDLWSLLNPGQRYELVTKALKQDPNALEFVTKEMMEKCTVAQKKSVLYFDASMMAHLPAETCIEELRQAIKKNSLVLLFITQEMMTNWSLEQRYQLALAAVNRTGFRLRDLKTTQLVQPQADWYTLALAAVSNDGNALQYVTDEMTSQWTQEQKGAIAHAAVKTNSFALGSVVPSMLNQRQRYDIALTAVKKNGDALKHVTSDMITGWSATWCYDVVLAAVQPNGRNSNDWLKSLRYISLDNARNRRNLRQGWNLAQRFMFYLTAKRARLLEKPATELLRDMTRAQRKHLALLQAFDHHVCGQDILDEQAIRFVGDEQDSEIKLCSRFNPEWCTCGTDDQWVALKKWIDAFPDEYQVDCLSALSRMPDINIEILCDIVRHFAKNERQREALYGLHLEDFKPSDQRLIVQSALLVAGVDVEKFFKVPSFTNLPGIIRTRQCDDERIIDICKKAIWAMKLHIYTCGPDILPNITSHLTSWDLSALLCSSVPPQSQTIGSIPQQASSESFGEGESKSDRPNHHVSARAGAVVAIDRDVVQAARCA